ncbi:MAG: acetylglutamate kinase [Bacteroidia bacterium]
MEKLNIIKIGGQVLDNESVLNAFLHDLHRSQGKKIIIHGGGKLATRLAAQLGAPQQMIDGRRITDADTLRIVTMVYAGLINKQLVALLQSLGTDALGLSGADMNCIKAHKRAVHAIDYGFVGDLDPASVNANKLHNLLNMDCTPVICSITHDGKGQLLNTNADTLAAAIAIAMNSNYDVQLNFCFEKKGVLRNSEDDNSLIPSLSEKEYKYLKEEKHIHQGMIPKLDNAFAALQQGVNKVIIGHSAEISSILLNHTPHGTSLCQ